MGVVIRRWVWLETIGVVSGCFPHITYTCISLLHLYLLFFAAASLLLFSFCYVYSIAGKSANAQDLHRGVLCQRTWHKSLSLGTARRGWHKMFPLCSKVRLAKKNPFMQQGKNSRFMPTSARPR